MTGAAAAAALALAAAGLPALLPGTDIATKDGPTRHQAKVRTFARLLAETEKPPDSADATHARVTVGGCRRRPAGGWACDGWLAPVDFSGIGGSTCAYRVAVTARRTVLHPLGCT